jgi:hypothetical protein
VSYYVKLPSGKKARRAGRDGRDGNGKDNIAVAIQSGYRIIIQIQSGAVTAIKIKG